MKTPRPILSVVGSASCDERLYQLAYDTGRQVAAAGALLVCGGGGGVMEAACAGAKSSGGTTVGVLPGVEARGSIPNEHVDIPIFTGIGQARNQIVVLSAQAVIAVGGGWGTLSEIALACKHGRPVVLLGSWGLEPPVESPMPVPTVAQSPAQAVKLAIEATKQKT